MTRWLSALTPARLVVLIALLGVFAMAARPSVDTDTWWHLRAGAWTVTHGEILTRDVFSFTRAGEPWINHSWLAQVILYTLWQTFGYAGLNLFTAALITLTFFLVYLQCAEGNPYLNAFVLILAAAASAIYWSARPQLISLALASVFAYLLYQYLWRKRNLLWLLPLLMLVWVNLHGGFAIGFILLALTLAGQVAGRVFDPTGPGQLSWRGIAWLAGVGVLCAAVLPLNPYGFTMYTYPLRTVSIGVLQDFIQEWQSPNFHSTGAQISIWLWLLLFVAVGLGRRRMRLTDLALVSGLTYSALLAGRNLPLLALVIPPMIARHTAVIREWLLEIRDWRLEIGQDKVSPSSPLPPSAPAPSPAPSPLPLRSSAPGVISTPLLNALILALITFAVAIKAVDASLPNTNRKAIAQFVPVAAVEYLKQHPLPGPLFNAYNWGGYLIWELYPDYPVYVDGRTDLYDDAILREYLAAALGQASYTATLDKYGMNLVLIENHSGLADRLATDAAWELVYADEQAVIYRRK